MAIQAAPALPRRRRTQEERTVETRAKLIRAAVESICELGYAHATTSVIAERAGLSRGALQHQFGTRLDLLVAVIDYLSDEMLRLTEGLPASGLPLSERIDAILKKYWEIYAGPIFMAVLHVFVGARSEPGVYKQLRNHISGIYRVNDRVWHAAFSDVDMPPERLAAARKVVLATLRGLAVGKFLGISSGNERAELKLLREVVGQLLLETPEAARPRRRSQ
jgi:AcrR family transcriptional regulator